MKGNFDVFIAVCGGSTMDTAKAANLYTKYHEDFLEYVHDIDLKFMKISIVLGRGIEGCGVTKNAVEWKAWLEDNGHTVTVYASKDKKWSRDSSHNIKNLIHVRFDNKDFDQVYEGCKSSDIIIFSSLRSTNHSQKCINNFSKLFDLPVKKVSFQHDHNKLSLKRNAQNLLIDSIEKVDMIFAHSTTSDFADMVKTPNLFDMREREIHLRQPAINFEEHKKYRKPVDQQDSKHHKWVGRTARWKGYDLMFSWHDKYLKDIGHLTTFEGIEKNIKTISEKARDGKLNIEDLQGGTFTISNGGVYGSMLSTPILNLPQSGVLGMHNIVERPTVCLLYTSDAADE